MNRTRLIQLVFGGAMLGVLTVGSLSCRTTPDFKSPYTEQELGRAPLATETREALTALLAERTHTHESLRLKADVVVDMKKENERNFFTALAMYQAPGNIRFRGTRNPIGTLFDIVIEDEEASLYFNREGMRFDGTLTQLAEKTEAIGGLSPKELVGAVLVQQELRDTLTKAEGVSVTSRGSFLLVATRLPETGRQVFWLVRKDDGLTRELLIRDSKGQPELRIEYLEYQMEQSEVTGKEEPLPRKFLLQLPAKEVFIEAEVKEYKLDVTLPPEAFERPEARKVYPLRSLAFEEKR